MAPPLSKDGSESKEGETRPDESEEASKPVGTGLSEVEELEKYVAIREEIYKKAKEFDSKVADFENAIRRPYFHVRPLNIIELENWHNYLDFMEREEDLNKVFGSVYSVSLTSFWYLVFSCPCYTLTYS